MRSSSSPFSEDLQGSADEPAETEVAATQLDLDEVVAEKEEERKEEEASQ